ncbi:MAG: sugar phosphate nucleotidyltransferase [Candidatus Micrarchaeota archaeon]
MKNEKVVILCGGEGTRLREETEFKPKPMVTVGGLPILWHIMKIYSHYGFKDFVLCLGYRGDVVKQFFINHELMHNDLTIDMKDRHKDIVHRKGDDEDWTITFAETGLKAMTGARVKRIERYVDCDDFLLTYGDGLSDVDIKKLLDFHKKSRGIGTLTAVHPHSKWGMVRGDKEGKVTEFVEKPILYDYVNGGFYCFRKDFFDYLSSDEGCVMEGGPMGSLVGEKKLSMLKHEGFWFGMDTYKDYLDLNRMWDEGKTPWKVWK